MAGKEAWFKSSDGSEISCNEGSVAYGLMTNDGSFTRIDGPGGEKIAKAEPEPEKEFATAGVTYSEEDAIAQNDGEDATAAPAKKPAAKKATAKKK
jgi:hypothetical protein